MKAQVIKTHESKNGTRSNVVMKSRTDKGEYKYQVIFNTQSTFLKTIEEAENVFEKFVEQDERNFSTHQSLVREGFIQ